VTVVENVGYVHEKVWLPDDGRLLLKHVGASIQNKGVVQSMHIVDLFSYV
jgi:hypothetical protein